MLLYLSASLHSVSLDPQQSPSGGALAQRLRALISLVRSASLAGRLPLAARRPSGRRHHRSFLLHHRFYLLHRRLPPCGSGGSVWPNVCEKLALIW